MCPVRLRFDHGDCAGVRVHSFKLPCPDTLRPEAANADFIMRNAHRWNTWPPIHLPLALIADRMLQLAPIRALVDTIPTVLVRICVVER